MRKKPPIANVLLASLLSLSACATAPTVCPKPPAPPAPVPLGPSFQDEMQLFLSGSLPEQTNSEKPSTHASKERR